MKRYYTALILVLVLLFTGCFKQDSSDCDGEGNCELRFFLHDADGANVFTDKIFRVDAVVFDAEHRYVTHKMVTEDELKMFAGTKLTLMPGEYRVVCWGNIDENTRVVGKSDKQYFEDLYLEVVSDATGDPLYYAPAKEVEEVDDVVTFREPKFNLDGDGFVLEIQSGDDVVKDMYFTRAYRRIEVYIKKYDEVVEIENPKVRLANLPYYYDFMLRTDKSRKNYESLVGDVNTPEGKLQYATFNVPISSFYDYMLLNIIKSSDAEERTSVPLKDWVEANEEKIEDPNELQILVEYFKDGNVSVKVLNWRELPVEPEWPE